MRNRIFYYSILAAFFFLSCSDSFLDEQQTGTLTTESALTSPESAIALANGAYVNTTVFNEQAFSFGGNTFLLLEYMTGKVTSENSQSNFKEFQDVALSARTPYVEEWWRGCYAGIAKCNLAIQKLPEYKGLIDDDLISKLTGEVKFMRAIYYYYLVRIFGDVPKIMVPQVDLDELQVSRSPLKEIYDEIIIPDLLTAESAPIPFKEQTGRVSMAAVKALLADVYLTYAGYPVQGGTEFYAQSAKRSLEIINSGEYSLFQNYEELWNPLNNNSGEFIFQVQFSVNKRSNELVPGVLPSRSGMSAFNLEYGSLIPTLEFVDSYVEGDKRAEEKQFFFTTYKGNPIKFSPGAPELEYIDFVAPYIHKYFDQTAIDEVGQSGLNQTIYRYADVLLMYAEAQASADGTANAQAMESLNLIRLRANLPEFNNTGEDAFIKEVWNQRYFELSYENKMWFDMIRTRLIRDDGTGEYVNFAGYINNWGKSYSETNLLFPLPLTEIQANSNLVQNPGYN
ncbi:MAG TPA: RagB/SusD family nutrient uptake outer membrane protein [Leeuwenhoekiella sp.]|nr:RagB/SusD family nutrient uptake outer membrane protein [Leeuwenhoekiella sp.]